jgi:hypothetical protein
MTSKEKRINRNLRNVKSSPSTKHIDRELEQEYVEYILKATFKPEMRGMNTIYEDSSKYPIVLTKAKVPGTAVATLDVTINGVLYSFPKDFDYHYSFYSEANEVTGNGYDMVKETLLFRNLPGHSSLFGRTEMKTTGCIYSPALDFSRAEILGNFQLNGTGVFKKVEGSGIAMFGVSTGFVVYHIAWIKGWPL